MRAGGLPVSFVVKHGIENNEELAHAGDERGLSVLTVGAQPQIENLYNLRLPLTVRRWSPVSGLNNASDVGRSDSLRSGSPSIGIGGSLTTPPLPHHRTYGAVYGGSAG